MTNWEIISSVIEIVASVAVIVTLIYVAIQIKLNAKQLERSFQATRTQNWHDVNESFNTWKELVLASNNSEIWIKGLNNLDELDRNEHMKFNMLAGTFIWNCWHFYHLSKEEGIVPDANNNIYSDLYKHEGFRNWLIGQERFHTDDFGIFIKSVRERVGEERYKIGESSSLTLGNY